MALESFADVYRAHFKFVWRVLARLFGLRSAPPHQRPNATRARSRRTEVSAAK
jgi:hypothetical protein